MCKGDYKWFMKNKYFLFKMHFLKKIWSPSSVGMNSHITQQKDRHTFTKNLKDTHEWKVSLLCCSQKMPTQSFCSFGV